MKICNISNDDFSNFAFSISEALKSVGQDCHSYKLQDHPFKYPKQSDIVTLEEMVSKVKEADVVQFFHDNLSLFNMIAANCKNKKLIAYHTTSLYRRDYDKLNELMNPFIHKAVNCMPEFMGKGAKNEVYMVGAVDLEALKERMCNQKSNIIGHFPSNARVKGTKNILDVLKETKLAEFVFKHDIGIEKYEEQLKRISECCIYIEMLTEKDGLGNDYGDFGITALEAAAMGCVVITQCNNLDIYRKHYGDPFFFIANTKDDLKGLLEGFIKNDFNQLNKYCDYSPVKTSPVNHSYKASGEYIMKNILND
jgi:hypothetical protein